MESIDILYEEGPCLVVCKPAGLLTQAPKGIDSLERRIKQFLIKRENKRGKAYLGVPHRLDRAVSGAMVFAKHVRAARRLSEQFEARTVRKTYWALVSGTVSPSSGTWTDSLRKIPNQAKAEIVPADHPEARLAVLRYRTLGLQTLKNETTENGQTDAWLQVELETGRMHQIRLQVATRGHPILGDALYGSDREFGSQHEDRRLRAIALHARRLEFDHPMTHLRVSVTAPLAADWLELGLPEKNVPAVDK